MVISFGGNELHTSTNYLKKIHRMNGNQEIMCSKITWLLRKTFIKVLIPQNECKGCLNAWHSQCLWDEAVLSFLKHHTQNEIQICYHIYNME